MSSGLDSSIVAAFAARQNPDLTAFSVGYSGRPESDERADAEKLARFLKMPFFDVELKTNEIVEFFPKLNFWRDDPIADIAGFGYYAVMQLARKNGVPVILQGQGGDELFWGYPQMRLARQENFKKAALHQNPFSQRLAQSLNDGWRTVKKRLANPEKLSFYEQSEDFQTAATQIHSFYHPQFSAQINEAEIYAPFNFNGDWKRAEIALTEAVCATYLRGKRHYAGETAWEWLRRWKCVCR